MNCNTLISLVAFKVIFLAAVFLFIRNYPSDRWFSVIFIVAGGLLAWCVAEPETVDETDTETEPEPVDEKVPEEEPKQEPKQEPVEEENKNVYSPDTS